MSVFVRIRKPLGFQVYSTDIYPAKVTLGFSSFILSEFIRNGKPLSFRPYYIFWKEKPQGFCYILFLLIRKEKPEFQALQYPYLHGNRNINRFPGDF